MSPASLRVSYVQELVPKPPPCIVEPAVRANLDQVLYILSKGLVALDSRVGYNGAVWGEDRTLPTYVR